MNSNINLSLFCTCQNKCMYLILGLWCFLSVVCLKWSLTGHWTNRSGLNKGSEVNMGSE